MGPAELGPDLNDLVASGLCTGMDDHDDLRALLSQTPLADPADRRARIRRAATERRRRRRAAVAVGAAAVTSLTTLGVASLRAEAPSVVTGPAAHPDDEQELRRIRGVHDEVWVSTGTIPVLGSRDIGAIPVGGAYITGAIETTRLDGSPFVLLAVSAPAQVSAVEVRGDGIAPSRHPLVDGHALADLPMEEWKPVLVLEVTAVDSSGAVLGRVRVAPFHQSPLSCETNPQVVGGDDASAGPQYIRLQDAYLGPPFTASCE